MMMGKGVERKSMMMNDKSKRVEWSNLPEELWLEISKHVKSETDIVRFRGIGRLWRNLLPLPSSYTFRILCHKIVLFESRIVFSLTFDGILNVCEIGDDKIGDKNNVEIWNSYLKNYDDIIIHKGNVYIVDDMGGLWWVEINLSPLDYHLVQVSPTICGRKLQKKHLVESDGSLYLVDTSKTYHSMYLYKFHITTDIHFGGKWENIGDLGDADNVFVLGRGSNYSLSTRHYYGLQRNCIYFFDGSEVCVFNLHNRKINQYPCIVGQLDLYSLCVRGGKVKYKLCST